MAIQLLPGWKKLSEPEAGAVRALCQRLRYAAIFSCQLAPGDCILASGISTVRLLICSYCLWFVWHQDCDCGFQRPQALAEGAKLSRG